MGRNSPIPSSPQIDDVIRRAYSGSRPYGFIAKAARSVNRTPCWVIKRAARLGFKPASKADREWSQEESDFADQRAMMKAEVVSRLMSIKGWKRTAIAIAHRRSTGDLASTDPAILTRRGLSHALGVSVEVVDRWTNSGLLIPQRGSDVKRDACLFHELDIAAFIVRNPGEIVLGRLEKSKAWFIDLMARCAAPQIDVKGSKLAKLEALLAARPELRAAQLAEMLDTTADSIVVMQSKLRTRIRDAA